MSSKARKKKEEEEEERERCLAFENKEERDGDLKPKLNQLTCQHTNPIELGLKGVFFYKNTF
jgi:hypothetical protein